MAAQIIPFPPAFVYAEPNEPPNTVHCSFCNRSNKKDKIVQGDAVQGKKIFICAKCVAMCNKLLSEEKAHA